MKLVVHFPLLPDREYLDDFDEDTIPNVGDKFDEGYIVKEKEVKGSICKLILRKGKNK